MLPPWKHKTASNLPTLIIFLVLTHSQSCSALLCFPLPFRSLHHTFSHLVLLLPHSHASFLLTKQQDNANSYLFYSFSRCHIYVLLAVLWSCLFFSIFLFITGTLLSRTEQQQNSLITRCERWETPTALNMLGNNRQTCPFEVSFIPVSNVTV